MRCNSARNLGKLPGNARINIRLGIKKKTLTQHTFSHDFLIYVDSHIIHPYYFLVADKTSEC